jgi:hypothetical protein
LASRRGWRGAMPGARGQGEQRNGEKSVHAWSLPDARSICLNDLDLVEGDGRLRTVAYRRA